MKITVYANKSECQDDMSDVRKIQITKTDSRKGRTAEQ